MVAGRVADRGSRTQKIRLVVVGRKQEWPFVERPPQLVLLGLRVSFTLQAATREAKPVNAFASNIAVVFPLAPAHFPDSDPNAKKAIVAAVSDRRLNNSDGMSGGADPSLAIPIRH